ncbi:UDP-galactopyranose mutase [Candidatus Chrysopegis kryptomonas]|uniref:UDP-galactopyranose mutase n=1 Tax=Candidatus Chryseopegocella kryptomonas TaxID=1633643 RepID=A0A0P1MXL1_9BACT|nr:UDP-galactopyranose mutase [Candidatus Chrysopegis kryptomonas]CUT00853.1 UDP-galactopyranose mutase [Candidatus Chrysopegis kryptomonas]
MKFDYLIVGAGFSGCILAERIATNLGKKVLIVERRNHIAGNAYDYYDENGILVHKYGPHIFHTNSKKVWDYLSRFTEWNIYYHKVLAVVDGKKIPVPFNLNSLYLIFPQKYAEKLEKQLIETFGYGVKIPILKLKEATSGELKFLADFIYEKVFLNYTTKQWGYKPEELDGSVTARVPVYISRDDRYFQDIYQGIPKLGYTKMFEKMINHPNIHILLNTDYREIIEDVKFNKLIYTGPVDYFFDYIYGELPYRSLRFEFKTMKLEYFQEVAQINYPNDYDFTRITEFKHMTGQKGDLTTIAYEFPESYIIGKNEPYYPIPKEENLEIYKKYLKEISKLNGIVYFVGRLAEYRYYNMDQIVARALNVFEKEVIYNI